jgi:hypothetical protein
MMPLSCVNVSGPGSVRELHMSWSTDYEYRNCLGTLDICSNVSSTLPKNAAGNICDKSETLKIPLS